MINDNDVDELIQEKAQRLGVPVIPKLPEGAASPILPNPTIAICGECGLEIKQVMGYSCSYPRCPVQHKATC